MSTETADAIVKLVILALGLAMLTTGCAQAQPVAPCWCRPAGSPLCRAYCQEF